MQTHMVRIIILKPMAKSATHANAANHDACMATFAAAGIYVFADLDTYSTALVEVSVTRAIVCSRLTCPSMELVLDTCLDCYTVCKFLQSNGRLQLLL